METNKQLHALFKQYEAENPNYRQYLTDSTYYELMSWYDDKHGYYDLDGYSDDAHAFANYVWNEITEPFIPQMSIHEQLHGGYELIDMGKDDLLSLYTMIGSSCLPERRNFDKIKRQIAKLLELK